MLKSAKHLYEFGPFRLDADRRRLVREGRPLSLTPKAFDTLLALVESSQQVVTKDDLMKKVWPDSFVEESNLTQNIFMLRKVLGDAAQPHRYILTVPGRGYRFAESVRLVPYGETDIVLEGHSRTQIILQELEGRPLGDAVASFFALLHRRPWSWIVPVLVVCLLGAIIVLKYAFRPKQLLGEADSVLISDFVNTTGEPVFDGALKQAVTVKLAESPYFNLVPDASVRQNLRLMGRSPDERIVPPVAREVCQRAGAKVAVGGSIVAIGEQYLVALDATNCLTGASLAHEEIRAQNKEQVLKRLGQVIPPLRRELGESLSSVQKFDTPIEQATTNSLAALKAYASGDEKRAQGQDPESVPFYKVAIDLDPNFAVAYARLATVEWNLGNREQSDRYLKEAFDRRERVSEREKFYIEAHFYDDSTQEFDKAIEVYKLWAQTYPRDWIPYNNLCNYYVQIGDLDHAIEAGREALRLNPNHGFPYGALARAYLQATRFAEARAIADRAIAAKRDGFTVHVQLYLIAFAEGDESAAQREMEWFKGNPLEGRILNLEAWAALSLGQARRGRALFEEARSVSIKYGFKDYAAATAIDEAQNEAELGNTREAREKAELGLNLMPDDPETEAGAALALARSGEGSRSEALAKDASARAPLHLLINNVTLPSVRASIDMNRRNFAGAIKELRRAAPYDLADAGDAPEGFTNYTRGRAYLEMHSPKEAAAEFQKILDNHGAAATSLYWTIARLGLARAYVQMGDTKKGIEQYQQFLALWKKADPDLRLLREVKAEYAKLSVSSN